MIEELKTFYTHTRDNYTDETADTEWGTNIIKNTVWGIMVFFKKN